jgi:hypothetical protein
MARWRPLSKRGTKPSAEEDFLYEAVPAHLVQPLIYWFDVNHRGLQTFMTAGRANRIAARLRLDLRPEIPKPPSVFATFPSNEAPSYALIQLASQADGTQLLDIVDATLAEGVSTQGVQELERLLADGGSAWRVADNGMALERRVDPTATDAFRHAATANPASHLAAAWTAAYGRNPNPTVAYSEAIKAVETACIPVVTPGAQGAKATLGKVIITLNDHQQDWQLAIHSSGAPADISPLLAMLRLLWQGQTDRHGGSTPTIPVTAKAAEAAVHLAVTLVQWFQSGTIQPVGTP